MSCITQNSLAEIFRVLDATCGLQFAFCQFKNVSKTPSLIDTINIVHSCKFREWLIEMWFCRLFGLSSVCSRNHKSSMLVPITVALSFKALINHLHSPFMSFIILKGMLSRFGK